MKIVKKTVKFVFAFFFISTLLIGCDTEDVHQTDSTENVLAILEIDDLTAEAENVIDDILLSEGLSSKNATTEKNLDMTCRTKTVVITGDTKTITIDFGEGCEAPNGNVLSGKIVLTIERDIDLKTKSIETNYDNFFVNDRQITGTKSIIHERENENGNFQTTMTFEQTIIWPDGETTKKEGSKVREWIAGKGTQKMRDNEFLITGSWEITLKDGSKLEAEVIEALHRDMSCKYILSGVLRVERPNLEGTIDYGYVDGGCDNLAEFTDSDGVVTEIEIKRRRKG